MESASIQCFDGQYMMSQKAGHSYSLIFADNNFDGNTDSCAIPVRNRREVELLLLSLGEEANVLMNHQERMLHPEIWDWLYGRTHTEILADLKWSYREEKEVIDMIEKIPIPDFLVHGEMDNDDDFKTKRIGQEYVHKLHPENVLISKPYRFGNMYYFNGYNATSEIHIDHSSDHMEGIVIFEAARQAGIASAHLEGMPFSGTIVILEAITRYSKFVDYHEPYLIRTIPACKPKGGRGFCVYNIVQNGKTCASGYFSVLVYNAKKTYEKFRHSKLIDKVSEDKQIVG